MKEEYAEECAIKLKQTLEEALNFFLTSVKATSEGCISDTWEK